MEKREGNAEYKAMGKSSSVSGCFTAGQTEEASSFDVIIPCYKPGEKFRKLLKALEKQELPPKKVILINTEERYFPKDVLKDTKLDIRLHHISRRDFDHAYARNLGVSFSDTPYFLCMTDDAVPADEKMTRALLSAFSQDSKIAEVYARQCCTKESSFDERLSRTFNYREASQIKGMEDLNRLGIKCFFASNVCCMYKREIFSSLRGFLVPTIFNEDMIFAARAEQAGYKVAYQAEARVYHSHRFTALQQFRRNFDLGVSHRDYREIFDLVPPEKEGIRMIMQNSKAVLSEGKAYLLFPLFFRTVFRFLGYKAGRNYSRIPKFLLRRFTLNPQYFQNKKIL